MAGRLAPSDRRMVQALPAPKILTRLQSLRDSLQRLTAPLQPTDCNLQVVHLSPRPCLNRNSFFEHVLPNFEPLRCRHLPTVAVSIPNSSQDVIRFDQAIMYSPRARDLGAQTSSKTTSGLDRRLRGS